MTDTPQDTSPGAAGAPVEALSYTEASRELDEIVRFVEQRDVDVDQLVGRLVRATALVEELDKRLRQTRMQVEQLVPRLAAVLSDAAPSAAGADARHPDASAGAGGGTATAGSPSSSRTGDSDELAELDEEDLEEMELAEGGADRADDSGSSVDTGARSGGHSGVDGAGGDDRGSTPELF